MKDRGQPVPEGDPNWTMPQLENFGRERLSRHFFMREMLYSEVASIYGMRNVPDNPELAVEVGKKLCSTLLEPLHATFGHVSIRSAFRSTAVNDCGKQHHGNVACTKYNRARHVWDQLDEKGKKGAMACVVVPWFVDYLEKRYPDPEERPATAWKAMAWWIHDHLPYSELQFFRPRSRKFEYAAFNIRWHETEVRSRVWCNEIVIPKKDRREHSPGDHASEYPGFPKLEHPNEFYPDPLRSNERYPAPLDDTGCTPHS